MHNPTAVQENDTHKLQWDFDIQTDHLNLGQKTRSYHNQQIKRTCCPIWTQNKTERKRKKDKYLELAMDNEGDDYTNRDWCIRYSN